MTREELGKILEQFAVCVLYTSMNTCWTPDEQNSMIMGGIDKIVKTVMFVNDRGRLSTPSIN
jgi:hypothetical protein